MPGSLALATGSAEDTRAVGRALAELLEPGDVVSLTGDLGAGKTTFVQGAAAGLGVTQPVLSPTFVLSREYDGRLRLYHLDLYRLDTVQQVLDIGFDDLVEAGGVVFVEWGDGIEALLPEDRLRVELTMVADGEDGRRIRMSADAAAWASRWDTLAHATDRWTHGDPAAAAGPA